MQLETASEGDGIGKLSCAWRAGEAGVPALRVDECVRGRDGAGSTVDEGGREGGRRRPGLVDDEVRDERQLTTICTGYYY